MNHLQPKSLLFYGVMIGSVTLLFRLVSGYGETNLTAPPDINGRYLSTQNLPGCPESTRLLMTLQQSGIYLNGFLLLVDGQAFETSPPATAVEEKPSLTGLWERQQISLAGTTPAFADCQGSSENESIPVSIQGEITEAPTAMLKGRITLGSDSALEFTAEREASVPRSQGH